MSLPVDLQEPDLSSAPQGRGQDLQLQEHQHRLPAEPRATITYVNVVKVSTTSKLINTYTSIESMKVST